MCWNSFEWSQKLNFLSCEQYEIFYANRIPFELQNITIRLHCGKSVRIRSCSGPYFPYSVRMRENTDQKNSEYVHFPCSVRILIIHLLALQMLKKIFLAGWFYFQAVAYRYTHTHSKSTPSVPNNLKVNWI